MLRREFLRNLFGLGLYLAVPGPLMTFEPSTRAKGNHITVDPTGHRTIFCQIADDQLRYELIRCARELKCRLISVGSDDPELLFLPHFVAVVDRNLIGDELWDIYVDWCDEGKIITPCVIIDDLKDWRIPLYNQVIFVDLGDNASKAAISELVDHVKRLRCSEQYLCSQPL